MRQRATAALAALLVSGLAAAAAPDWNQEENVAEAAKHIAILHAKEGPQKAIDFVDACYRTHGLASDYSRAFEGCIVRDFLLAHVIAARYAQVPVEERKKLRLPEPDAITGIMGQRVAAAFKQYDVSAAEADKLRDLIGKVGVPVFMAIAFPKSTEAPAGTDGKETKKK